MKVIFRNYIFSSIILWLFCLFATMQGELKTSTTILYLNLATIIFYYVLLQQSWHPSKINYDTTTLFWLVFIFSLFFTVIYKMIYYDDHGDFFSINSLDAINYHKAALKNANFPIWENIGYYMKHYHYDDLGALIFTTIIYKIIPSTLFLDFVNIFLGTISAIALFKIALYFMPRKYSFLCAVSYTCSSFVIQFESSGLKEPLFSYIVILCFLFFMKYVYQKKIRHLFYLFLFASTIILFRPVVLGFLLISIGIGLLFHSRKRRTSFFIIILIMIAALFTVSTFTGIFQTYSSFDKSISLREDVMKIAGERTAIYAAIISGMFGPLPTFLPSVGREISSIYSVGLLFRVLLSVPFWLCLVYIVKKKFYALFPFMIMIILEIVSLIFVLAAYELRYHLIHLPFVFLLAFYYIYNMSYSSPSDKLRIIRIVNYASIILLIIVFYWNWRLL